MTRPHFVTFNPFAAGFADPRLFASVTFYSRDDWTAYEPYRHLWGAIESAFAQIRARRFAVVTVSDVIMDRIKPTGPRKVVPNGVDAEIWTQPAKGSRYLDGLARPIVTYSGTLDERLSFGALKSIIEAIPDGTLALVGPRPGPLVTTLAERHRNVRVINNLAPADLASLISASDACVVPHVRTRLTEAMSPLKVYEYLAAGRPVVATDLDPIRGIHPSVALVESDAAFGRAVLAAVLRGPLDDGERHRFIEENTWSSRGDAVLDLVLDADRGGPHDKLETPGR